MPVENLFKNKKRAVLKHFSAFFVPLFIISTGVVSGIYYSHSNNARILLKSRVKNDITLNKKVVSDKLTGVVTDLLLLAGNSHLLLFFETGDESYKEDLAEDFLLFADRKKIYDQIRYIDINGMEIVRINYNNASPSVVPDGKLQNKNHRYYFTETKKLNSNEIYISPLDLNIENNEVERPFKPMIRFGTPIFSKSGVKRGVIILNYFGSTLLNKIKSRQFEPSGNIMLLNAEGYWLKGGTPDQNWGFMFKTGRNEKFMNYYPRIWNKIASSSSGQFYDKKGFYSFTTIYPLSEVQLSAPSHQKGANKDGNILSSNRHYFWKIISAVPATTISADSRQRLIPYLSLTLPLLIILGIISWLISVSNIRRKSAESELKKSHEDLELRVETRTNELAITNKRLKENITELKEARETLHSSEKYFRSLINNLHEDILVIDKAYRITDTNETFLANTGYSREEVINRRCFEVTHGYNKPCDEYNEPCSMKIAFKTTSPQTFINRNYKRHNKTIWADIALSPFVNSNGRATHVIHACRDITSLKKIENALFESEEKYRFLVDNAQDAIFILQNGRIQFANSVTEEITGLSKKELEKKGLADLVYPRDKDVIARQINQEKVNKSCQFRLATGEDEITWVELNQIDVNWQNRPASLNFLRDISEQKSLEDKLRQAQKMEAIGTLAGGIAHDFNNILFPIMGFTEMALENTRPENKVNDYLLEILNGTKRAKDLVSQILTFSRQTEKVCRPLLVHLVVKEAMQLINSSLPSTIEIIQNIDKKSGKVLADPTQIHQIIMNLCTNAYHAMQKEGGTLEISLKNVSLDTEGLLGSDLKPGSYILLRICDTGHGIEKKSLARIYDPYFTTKEKGEGTGLGLSVVHGIVSSIGGTINVYSDPGKGTAFNIYLPEYKEEETIANITADPDIPRGSEHLILVDDEESIIRVEQAMLEDLGYRITSFTDSTHALKAFKSSPEDFDLVITDLTMPGVAGDKLAKILKEIRPDIPLILLTGFGGEINEGKAAEIGVNAFLLKPPAKSVFARTIRQVLDS